MKVDMMKFHQSQVWYVLQKGFYDFDHAPIPFINFSSGIFGDRVLRLWLT